MSHTPPIPCVYCKEGSHKLWEAAVRCENRALRRRAERAESALNDLKPEPQIAVDGIQTAQKFMSESFGLSKEESESILKQVRENLARLNGCDLHDFKPINLGDVFSKERCSRCKGEVDNLRADWYKLGLEHGATLQSGE